MTAPLAQWVPDRQFRWATALLVAVSLFMLQMPDGFTWANVGKLSTDAFSGGGTAISKVQWLPLFALGGLLLLLRFRLAMAMLPHLNPFLVAMTLWVLASALWSYDPGLTLRRAIKVVGAVVIAWGVVMACWDYGRYERVLRWTILAYLLASLAFMAVQPQLGIHQAYENEAQLAGSWRGLATHKNPFGAVAGIGMVFWLHALLTQPGRGTALFGLAVTFVCLVGARSSTSLLCSLLACTVLVAALRTQLVHRPGGLLLFLGALFLVPFLWFVILSGFPTIEEALGPLTALVNNAGVVDVVARVDEMSVARLKRMFDINMLGSFVCAREAIRRMSTRHGGAGGSIVNLSSAAARLGGPGQYVDYAASKGAIDTFTLGLAREVAAEGIRVNAVRPGIIETDIHASGGQPDRARQLAPLVPMRCALRWPNRLPVFWARPAST